ncbi:SCP2 sterol-binding domain-containing protein [Candidatus Amarolinea dominans]|uniref:SCP2 sterol-binding domain-containing protein n=1 Tax=Candidatus Amarolinea dominans TaxID=3140696 RepID=UPI0031365744|nr:SCP2 sterol-binding domain-containing protein [Anaerolineae bacterium]
MEEKLRGMMASMPMAFIPEAAEGVEATIQYHLTGEGASDWGIHIADGACTVNEGLLENPTLTLTMDSQDYVDMIAGRLNGMSAFMSGKLQLDGDIMLATRLFTMFKMGR